MEGAYCLLLCAARGEGGEALPAQCIWGAIPCEGIIEHPPPPP